MIFLAVVLGCLGAFIILCCLLEEQIRKVVGLQRKQDERISKIEEHEYAQDARLDRQQVIVKNLTTNVRELGKDLGWDDDGRKTELSNTVVMIDPKAPLKDEPPDDAA